MEKTVWCEPNQHLSLIRHICDAIIKTSSPCDSCGSRDMCRSRRLACGAFRDWVDTGAEMRSSGDFRRPTRAQYNKLFPLSGNGVKKCLK